MRISKVYDVLAPVYGRVVPGLYELATSRAAERLSAGAPATILEVGVGPGHILTAVGHRNKSAMAVGVDVSKGMLNQSKRMLKKRNVQAKLVLGDAVQLPFRDGSFEGVVTSFLLDLFRQEQIPDALREMCRVLAPGGRIVVATLQFSNPIFRQLGLWAHRFLPGVAKRIQLVDFREFLEGTGLRVLQDEQIPAAGTRLLTLVKVVG